MEDAEWDVPPVARVRVAAGALFVDGDQRVLMVRPTYKAHWDIPGGYLEPGESPRHACRRELEEELGLAVEPGRLLTVDWAPLPDEGDKLLFIFDGGTLSADQLAGIRLPAEELTEYAFVALDTAEGLTTPRLHRRLASTLEARNAGSTSYLEHGQAPDLLR